MSLFKREQDYQKERELTVFARPYIDAEEPPPSEPASDVYDQIAQVIDRAKAALDSLMPVAEAYSIPIPADENEVRAAHLQLGGDGESIKFQEFANALDALSNAQEDLLNPILNGLGIGDQRVIERNKTRRGAQALGQDSSWLDDLAGFGVQSLLLWALNGLIGLFHSVDHAGVTSAKTPQGTEVGALIAQILTALSLLKFVQGLSDEAIASYEGMLEAGNNNLDFGNLFREYVQDGGTPPDSEAYRRFAASMYESNSMRLANYSTGYIAAHVGEGFEAWWAYLVARETHEQGLRTYNAGEQYIDGSLDMPAQHKGLVNKQVNSSNSVLDNMETVLGTAMSGEESCCFLRWLDLFELDVLRVIRNIIQMAINLLSMNVANSMNWHKNLANYPWRVISQKILEALDSFYDKIVKQVLDAFEIDGEIWEIIQACTPVNELINSVLKIAEYIKQWYHDLISSIDLEWDTFSVSLNASWDTMYEIRRAKEILLALDQMIAFKTQLNENESVSEDKLTGAISTIQGFMFTHEIPGAEGLTPVKGFTQDAVEWCRTLGDWDKLKEKVARNT